MCVCERDEEREGEMEREREMERVREIIWIVQLQLTCMPAVCG